MVLTLERVPESLRGELTRWLLEPRPGIFVGQVAAPVRDRLWEKACRGLNGGGALLIYSTDGEQGFVIRMHGDPRRGVVDFEGLQLIRIPS